MKVTLEGRDFKLEFDKRALGYALAVITNSISYTPVPVYLCTGVKYI